MNKAQFQISEPARKDIAHIWANVYDRSLSSRVADKVLNEIYKGIQFLAENPGAGHYREDLHPKPLKFLSVYSYLIVYRIVDVVEIVRVLPGQMDVEAILQSETP